MRTKPQGRSQDNLIKHGSGGVYNQLRPTSGSHYAPQISRVDMNERDRAPFAQESAGAIQVAIAAGDLMPLSGEQVREIRAGRSGPQDEDAHRGRTVPYSFRMWLKAAPMETLLVGCEYTI